MKTIFKEPDFTKGDIELRFEDDVICIYGTPNGLKRVIDICHSLLKTPAQGHIHLEECNLLTSNSKKGAIAIFTQA